MPESWAVPVKRTHVDRPAEHSSTGTPLIDDAHVSDPLTCVLPASNMASLIASMIECSSEDGVSDGDHEVHGGPVPVIGDFEEALAKGDQSTCSFVLAESVSRAERDEFTCPICHEFAFNASLLPCSCELIGCTSCLSKALETKPQCPMCREQVPHGPCPAPRIVQRLISRVAIECPHRGCAAIVPFGLLMSHFREFCGAVLLRCRGCGLTAPRGSWADSHAATCPARTVRCPCGQRFAHRDAAQHVLTQCLIALIPCPVCLELVRFRELVQHFRTSCTGSVPVAQWASQWALLEAVLRAHAVDFVPRRPGALQAAIARLESSRPAPPESLAGCSPAAAAQLPNPLIPVNFDPLGNLSHGLAALLHDVSAPCPYRHVERFGHGVRAGERYVGDSSNLFAPVPAIQALVADVCLFAGTYCTLRHLRALGCVTAASIECLLSTHFARPTHPDTQKMKVYQTLVEHLISGMWPCYFRLDLNALLIKLRPSEGSSGDSWLFAQLGGCVLALGSGPRGGGPEKLEWTWLSKTVSDRTDNSMELHRETLPIPFLTRDLFTMFADSPNVLASASAACSAHGCCIENCNGVVAFRASEVPPSLQVSPSQEGVSASTVGILGFYSFVPPTSGLTLFGRCDPRVSIHPSYCRLGGGNVRLCADASTDEWTLQPPPSATQPPRLREALRGPLASSLHVLRLETKSSDSAVTVSIARFWDLLAGFVFFFEGAISAKNGVYLRVNAFANGYPVFRQLGSGGVYCYMTTSDTWMITDNVEDIAEDRGIAMSTSASGLSLRATWRIFSGSSWDVCDARVTVLYSIASPCAGLPSCATSVETRRNARNACLSCVCTPALPRTFFVSWPELRPSIGGVYHMSAFTCGGWPVYQRLGGFGALIWLSDGTAVLTVADVVVQADKQVGHVSCTPGCGTDLFDISAQFSGRSSSDCLCSSYFSNFRVSDEQYPAVPFGFPSTKEDFVAFLTDIEGKCDAENTCPEHNKTFTFKFPMAFSHNSTPLSICSANWLQSCNTSGSPSLSDCKDIAPSNVRVANPVPDYILVSRIELRTPGALCGQYSWVRHREDLKDTEHTRRQYRTSFGGCDTQASPIFGGCGIQASASGIVQFNIRGESVVFVNGLPVYQRIIDGVSTSFIYATAGNGSWMVTDRAADILESRGVICGTAPACHGLFSSNWQVYYSDKNLWKVCPLTAVVLDTDADAADG